MRIKRGVEIRLEDIELERRNQNNEQDGGHHIVVSLKEPISQGRAGFAPKSEIGVAS